MKDKIRKYPKQIREAIKRIAVFDFDGTLVDSPIPEIGKEVYKAKTGEDWPHKGWWGRPETLDMDIFDIPVIDHVIADYEIEKAKDDTMVIMLTGRMPKLASQVEKILAAKGLEFHGYFYNTGGATLDFKIGILQTFVERFPNLTSLVMWDDRLEHIPSFQKWGNALQDIEFDITIVEGNHHGPQ